MRRTKSKAMIRVQGRLREMIGGITIEMTETNCLRQGALRMAGFSHCVLGQWSRYRVKCEEMGRGSDLSFSSTDSTFLGRNVL
jgi:hypothetical protein